MDAIFPKLLAKCEGQTGPLAGLASKLLDQLDRNASKKNVYSAIQGEAINQYREYCEQIKAAGDVVFQTPDAIF